VQARRHRCRKQALEFRRRIVLGLRREVIEMMVVDRARVRGARATGIGDGVLLLRCRLRENPRCLDGADTGPEQDKGEAESDQPKGHR
jgi:hypothetical protein